MFRKLLSLFLCALMLLSAVFTLASCADPTESTADTTQKPGSTANTDNPGNTTETAGYSSITDIIPESVDFGGETVTFVYVEGKSGTFTGTSIWVDEADQAIDNVTTAVYDRNYKIEQDLGVQIESFQAAEGIGDLFGAISNTLEQGLDDYDIIAGYQYFDLKFAKNSYLIDLNNLPADINYFDVDANYWANNYVNSITSNDHVFWVTGPLSMRYLGGMYCTFVNARMYNANLKGTYGDIYQYVKDGNWTLDNMMAMAEASYQDIGTLPGEVDEGDVLGFVIERLDCIDGMAFGCDLEFSSVDANGKYVISLNNNRTYEFTNKLNSLLNSSYTYIPTGGDESVIAMTLFSNCNVLFTINKIYQAEVFLQTMVDDFYIIPTPKLNSDQQNYTTGIHDGCTIYGVIYCGGNIGASVATLTQMGHDSANVLNVEYYEKALLTKYTKDGESGKMIEDYIAANVNIDFVAAWSESIDNICHIFRDAQNTKNISVTIQRKQSVWNNSLTKLITALDEAAATSAEGFAS